MSKLRPINTHFWKDRYIRTLNPSEKILFLYLLTNEAAGLSGCYEIVVEQISLDTGLQLKKVTDGLEKLQKDSKIIFKDDWMVLLNFLRHQKLNANMGIAAGKELANAPEWLKTTLRRVLIEKSILPEWFPKGSEPLPNGSRTVAGIERERELEDEGEAPEPKGFESVEPELLVKQTEDVLKTRLTPDQKKNLCAVIPKGFVLMWLPYLKGRMVGLKKGEKAEAKIGYWLTDFQRDYKGEYEKLRKPQQQLTPAAEKTKQDEERRRANPVQPPPADFMRGVSK